MKSVVPALLLVLVAPSAALGASEANRDRLCLGWGRLGTFQVPYMVSGIGNFCAVEEAGDVKSFFAAHPVPAAERGIQQAIEEIERCAAMRARQSAPFGSWLARQ
jgi:hypothetical protein